MAGDFAPGLDLVLEAADLAEAVVDDLREVVDVGHDFMSSITASRAAPRASMARWVSGLHRRRA